MQSVDLVVKAVNESLSPKKIILFGSRGNGNGRLESDLDVAVIQKDRPKLGQKADVLLTLAKLGYDWTVEPDIHLFSEVDFERRLRERDLFVTEVAKGKVVYG